MPPPLNGCMMGSAVMFFAFAILFLVGFGSPYWVVTTMDHHRKLGFDVDKLGAGADHYWIRLNFGLWRVCGQTRRCAYWVDLGDTPGYMKGAQALMCLGLVTTLAAVGAYIWWIRNQYRAAARRLALTLTTLAGVLTLLAVIVFGGGYADDISLVGWGFWNTVLCAIGLFITGTVSACTLAIAPIGKKPPEEIKVNIPEEQVQGQGQESPKAGSENPAYVATPATAAGTLRNTPGEAPVFTLPGGPEHKMSYTESLDSSFAGSSITGCGLTLPPLVTKAPVGTTLSRETPPAAASTPEGTLLPTKPYYYSGAKDAELLSTSTQKPTYYTAYPQPSTSQPPEPSTQQQQEAPQTKPKYYSASAPSTTPTGPPPTAPKPQYPYKDTAQQQVPQAAAQVAYPYRPQEQHEQPQAAQAAYPYRPQEQQYLYQPQQQPQYLTRPQSQGSRPTSYNASGNTESDV